MTQALPDCTGQKFGMLTVLGRGERLNNRPTWRLLCVCGKIIQKPRGDFDRKTGYPQTSCGCQKKFHTGRKPKDLSGQTFGTLTALKLSNTKTGNHPNWLLKCTCGGFRELCCSVISSYLKRGERLTCGNRNNHPDLYLEYPPNPIPYPQSASEIVAKYLHLTKIQEIDKTIFDHLLEDEKVNRLIRAAWIIVYRRMQGEIIADLHEKRIINKWFRYASIKTFWDRKLEVNGGFLRDRYNNKKQTGSTMTDLTLNNYPEIETQGITMLPSNPVLKHLKFKRC